MKYKLGDRLYCINCDSYRKQSYITKLEDNTLVYICRKCYCQNFIKDEES